MSERRPAEAYGAFAFAFDHALGRLWVTSFGPLLDDILDRYEVRPATHLDLACGTGLVLPGISERGLETFGVDASIPMLAQARGRVRHRFAGDIRQLPVGTAGFGLVTCFYDSLNHLLVEDDLESCFSEVVRVLAREGRFIFDINHPSAFERIWASRKPFVSADLQHELTIRTSYKKRSRMAEAEVSGWAIVKGRRTAIHETRVQRAWSPEEISKSLEGAGLETVEIIGFDPFAEPGDEDLDPPSKIVFVAGRAGSGERVAGERVGARCAVGGARQVSADVPDPSS